MKYGWLLCFLLILLTGCSETFTITRGSYPSEFDEANLQCVGTTNRIRLRDGTTVNTRKLLVAADSVQWTMPDGQRQQARLWEIARIDNVNHGRGSRNGAFAGLLAGLSGGLVLASNTRTRNTLGDIALGAATSAIAIAGVAAGVTVGKLIGYRTVIKFDSAAVILTDTMRAPVRSAAGWSMPGASDSTHKP